MTTATATRPFAGSFIEYGRRHPEVMCLSADLTSSVEADDFQRALPAQFLSLGMAEQSMMSFAGGLARQGKVPFITTFSVFVTRRPYDQVAMSIAYPNLPVRLMGFLPGLTTPGGVTHQAIDDVSLMRSLPNMTVLDLGDATEVETVWGVLDEIPGPVFCRVLRGEVPRLFEEPMALGKVRHLTDDGDDVLVISSGVSTGVALPAVEALRAAGVGVRHLHAATLKPFDDPSVLAALGQTRHGVVTVENHSTIGGLGSIVAELIAENGVAARLRRVGVPDTFTHGGQRDYLFSHYGLDGVGIVRAVEELLGRSTGVDADGLGAQGQLTATAANAKAEAL